jgi:acetyltransferase-like isoleucine patch superfamily enzyme
MADLVRLPWQVRYVKAPAATSALRRLSILATHRHADVQIDPTARLGPRFALWIPERGHLRIDDHCVFRRDFYAEVHGEGIVEIGPSTTFTSASVIQISTSLTIGKRCVFGNGTLIADGNHRFRDHTRHLLDQGYDHTPITIGDGAVVMSKCTVIAPIGVGAVIGANSVVTTPVPDYCLAAGAPARVIEYFGPPELAPDIEIAQP